MNFGELMSFIKVVENPGINIILVDVNFSLNAIGIDSQAHVNTYLSNLDRYAVENQTISSLSPEFFLAHLCVHFYKEATDIRWIEKQRDMSLYKILDIYELFMHNSLN